LRDSYGREEREREVQNWTIELALEPVESHGLVQERDEGRDEITADFIPRKTGACWDSGDDYVSIEILINGQPLRRDEDPRVTSAGY